MKKKGLNVECLNEKGFIEILLPFGPAERLISVPVNKSKIDRAELVSALVK